MSGPVGAILLAGGAGRRAAPHDKLLARDAAGHTMIARSADSLCRSQLGARLLVLGHDATRLADACPDFETIVAPDHAEGLAGTLRGGIAHASAAGWRAALVCLADMPLLTPRLIDHLIKAYLAASGRPGAVAPAAGGVRGNPVLWDRRMFPSLMTLRGDTGGRALLERPETALLLVETGEASVLADFDTPERLALFARTGRD